MMVERRDWVRLPTNWIRYEEGLREFHSGSASADKTAALMLLMAIAHHADDMTGMARLTYENFEKVTGRSREKIARGLDVLSEHNLVDANTDGRSTYCLVGYDRTQGWGKLPCRRLYTVLGVECG